MDKRPQLVALDSMNYWIEGKNCSLNKVIESVDLLFVDEGEARAIEIKSLTERGQSISNTD